MKDINLLPNDMKKNKRGLNANMDELRDKLEPKKILSIILVIFALGFIFALPLIYNKFLEGQVATIKKDINNPDFQPVKEVRTQIASENSKIDAKKKVITEIDTKNISVNEIFSAISGILPAGCSVSSMTYSGNSVSITGTLAEDIQIGEIIERVKRLNFLVLDNNSAISYDTSKNFSLTFNVTGKAR